MALKNFDLAAFFMPQAFEKKVAFGRLQGYLVNNEPWCMYVRVLYVHLMPRI